MDGVLVLDRIDLAIGAAEIVALLGANGAGKTTLLQCLAGRLRPSEGQVLWYGQSPRRRPPSHRKIGYAGHESSLYPELTAVQNLLFAARMHGMARPKERAVEMLATVGLEKWSSQVTGRMSRGMRQRLSLARALIHSPPIVLLDEPFSGLDANGRQWLEEWLAELRALNHAILVITHDQERSHRFADRVYELTSGRLNPIFQVEVRARQCA
jgi:heme exporter protein A